MKLEVLLILLFATIKLGSTIDENTDLARLNQNLSNSFDRNRRPVRNENDKTNITVSLTINYFKFNEDSQEMIIQAANDMVSK